MKDICVDYNSEHPYREYYENHWDNKEKVPHGGTVIILSLCLIPYRIWLIFKDIFVNPIQDLCTKQFAGKKCERLAYNLISGIILNPLYLIAGLIILVFNALFVLFDAFELKGIANWLNDISLKIEAISTYPYNALAGYLGLDEKKYYDNDYV